MRWVVGIPHDKNAVFAAFVFNHLSKPRFAQAGAVDQIVDVGDLVHDLRERLDALMNGLSVEFEPRHGANVPPLCIVPFGCVDVVWNGANWCTVAQVALNLRFVGICRRHNGIAVELLNLRRRSGDHLTGRQTVICMQKQDFACRDVSRQVGHGCAVNKHDAIGREMPRHQFVVEVVLGFEPAL